MSTKHKRWLRLGLRHPAPTSLVGRKVSHPTLEGTERCPRRSLVTTQPCRQPVGVKVSDAAFDAAPASRARGSSLR
jgi:hypothetical protein